MKRNISLIIVALIVSLTASAQSSRKYIKDKIDEWGSCRNVAITLTGGDIALNQTNAYAYSGIPTGLAEAIKDLHADGEFIDDIQLTEDGSWLILYGDNGFRGDGIPSDLETVIRQYNRDQEVVTSVTFNDKGDWIVISQEHINASNSSIYDWIQSGIDKFGQLWAAHLTDDGMVLCFEEGYKYLGEVPDTLRNKLKETSIDVYRVKFLSDGTYFIADKKGTYAYYM